MSTMSARAALEIRYCGMLSISRARGGGLQAQALDVVLQIPFVQLSKAPVLKVHDADRGRLTQGLNFGSVFGDALFQ
ncbi:hypothetical protein SRABI06_04715 [Pseudomonas brassicacearum]|nr:hypothetical protein SRABI06_04715 [Pseudomonas brassicacearum]